MHGGKGSGAPQGNRNAVRAGLYTKEVLAREAKARDLRQRLRAAIAALEPERRTPTAKSSPPISNACNIPGD
jgi:hypothetical protein